MPGSPDRHPAALAFSSVASGYGRRTVLEGIDFSIPEGEFVSLIGPNGSGKSTLLKTATGLIRPMHGSVTVFGRPISSLKPSERAASIGVVPQKLESPMAFTVSEIVMIGRQGVQHRFARPDSKDQDSAERAMIYTNVFDLRDRLFNELSAGEQQRAALAMALAREPRIMMLDESIAHLDINHSQEVLRILMNLNRERKLTVFLVSHDLNLAAQVADRLLLVDEGRLVGNGSPGEVMDAALLSRVYGCDLRIRMDPYGGHPVVSGTLDEAVRRPATETRLHIISGGGSGIELFRMLLLEGYAISAGVLNLLDSDAEAARALNIPCALEQPFSAIGREAIAEARRMIGGADGVVVGPVPFGPGNVVNLELALDARRSGKPVWMAAGIAERDYTVDRSATRISSELRGLGAVEWRGIRELTAICRQKPVTGGGVA